MLSGMKIFTADSKQVVHYCNSLMQKQINIFLNSFPVSNIYIFLYIAKLGRRILRKQEIKRKAAYIAEIKNDKNLFITNTPPHPKKRPLKNRPPPSSSSLKWIIQ